MPRPAKLSLSPQINVVAFLFFLASLALSLDFLIPTLDQIDPWDESLYIQMGKELAQGTLTTLSYSPLVTAMYGLGCQVFDYSSSWMSLSCAMGRLLMFSALWWGVYLVACFHGGLAIRLIVLCLLCATPALRLVVTNSSHTLFSATSAFALYFFLTFHQSKRLTCLALSSMFLGLGALCRSEAMITFFAMIALVAMTAIRDRRILASIVAGMMPYCALVGGYMLFYGIWTGNVVTGTAERSYFVFEQGHSFANRDQYPGQNEYMAGMADARKLFGMPAQNDYSILKAIQRNPMAYLDRIPKLSKMALSETIQAYGWGMGIFCLLFAVRGAGDLALRREFFLLGSLAAWSVYNALYLLLCFQRSHLVISIFILFPLAAIGITGLLRSEVNKVEIAAWSLLLLLLSLTISAPHLAVVCVVLMITLWIVYLLKLNSIESQSAELTGAFLLLFAALLINPEKKPSWPPSRTTSPLEQAVREFRERMPEAKRVAAISPGRVWASDKTWIPIPETFNSIHTAAEFSNWLDQNKVDAVFVDGTLLTQIPSFKPIATALLGNKLRLMYVDIHTAVIILAVQEKALP